MIFRRSPNLLAVASEVGVTDLSPVATRDLIAVLVGRGFEVTIAGVSADLLARVERAEALLAAAAVEEANYVDAGPVVKELGRIAGCEFPKLVGEHIELRRRADRSEREAELLAGAVYGPAFHALDRGLPTDTDTDT